VTRRTWWRQWNGAPKWLGGEFIKVPNYDVALTRSQVRPIRLFLVLFALFEVVGVTLLAVGVLPLVFMGVLGGPFGGIVGFARLPAARRHEIFGGR
jgi:hypothetical protein